MNFILTILIVFLILVINELNWRVRHVHGEFSRKFVHISVGCLVALWPFYLSWKQIRILGALFLIVVLISQLLKIFQAIHSVQRPTWGEACFALSVIGVSFVTQNKWIYFVSILQMSLADGLAGIIGMRFGGKYNYIIFSHTKSLIGTLTFFVASILILVFYSHHGGAPISGTYIFLISFISAILENISILGLDNLTVPLLTAILLSNH